MHINLMSLKVSYKYLNDPDISVWKMLILFATWLRKLLAVSQEQERKSKEK